MLSSLKHGRCDEHCSSSNGGGGGFLKVAMASPPPPHCFFLASSSSQMMLSFSSGLGSGSSDASMQGVLARVKGPFTPNQWVELEHQALIYKHIVANAPVPPTLLLSIRRSLHPSVFQSFSSGGTLGSSSFGWGSFHLGYTGSADPEPGRCRRTDGKKWRCSRDAVVDQKYCERHINRGRHRSRKHVEGRSSHVAKAMPAIAQPALGASGGLSGSHAMVQHPTKSLAVHVADPCATRIDRMLLDKGNAIDHAPKVITLSEETTPRIDYTAVTTDSLMNTARTENLNLVPLLMLNERPQQNPIHHFFNKDMQSDGTHLSISVPMDKPNFLSNSYDQADISLGVGGSSNDGNNARASWIPASWETSIGGPLGEFFTDTSNASDDKIKNCPSTALNLLTDGRATSDQLHSPTGVLQMTNINSVSSSTVSSPGSLCNSLLAASLVNPQTVQTL